MHRVAGLVGAGSTTTRTTTTTTTTTRTEHSLPPTPAASPALALTFTKIPDPVTPWVLRTCESEANVGFCFLISPLEGRVGNPRSGVASESRACCKIDAIKRGGSATQGGCSATESSTPCSPPEGHIDTHDRMQTNTLVRSRQTDREFHGIG